MKTEIEITGQIGGNSILKHAIQTSESEMCRSRNGFIITFNTRKEAYKALSVANKQLREEEPEWAKDGISYRPKYSLSYDASFARIIL